MIPVDVDEITLDILNGEQLELAECIGIEAYRKLVKNYGGMTVYIYKPDTFLRSERDNKIRQEFNGVNYKYLAQKYDLSERYIRSIVSDELFKIRTEPMSNQISFDDNF